VADFNGDGHPDVMTMRSQWHSGFLYTPDVFLGDGHGGFTDATGSIYSGAPPQTMGPGTAVVADFNGDGRPDVFVPDFGPDLAAQGYRNTLILSAPGGKLVDATRNLPAQIDTTQVDATATAAVADVNGDGAPDLFIGEIGGERDNGILLNDGHGRFVREQNAIPQELLGPCSVILSAAFADVNGDGSPDLIEGGGTNPCQAVPTAVLLNDGHGRFPTLSRLPMPPFGFDTPLDIEAGDLNGDGAPDLVIGWSKQTFTGLWLQIDINDGHGNFTDETASRLPPQADNHAGVFYHWIRLVDLNQDGRPDIATSLASGGLDTDPYFINDGTGVFTPLPNSLGHGPVDTYALGELGGGRDLDMIYGGDPTILFTQTTAQPPGTLYVTAGPANYLSFINESGGSVRKPRSGFHKLIMWNRSASGTIRLKGPGVNYSDSATGVSETYVTLARRSTYTLTSPTRRITFHTTRR
jgi:hypothetical protein